MATTFLVRRRDGDRKAYRDLIAIALAFLTLSVLLIGAVRAINL